MEFSQRLKRKRLGEDRHVPFLPPSLPPPPSFYLHSGRGQLHVQVGGHVIVAPGGAVRGLVAGDGQDLGGREGGREGGEGKKTSVGFFHFAAATSWCMRVRGREGGREGGEGRTGWWFSRSAMRRISVTMLVASLKSRHTHVLRSTGCPPARQGRREGGREGGIKEILVNTLLSSFCGARPCLPSSPLSLLPPPLILTFLVSPQRPPTLFQPSRALEGSAELIGCEDGGGRLHADSGLVLLAVLGCPALSPGGGREGGRDVSWCLHAEARK